MRAKRGSEEHASWPPLPKRGRPSMAITPIGGGGLWFDTSASGSIFVVGQSTIHPASKAAKQRRAGGRTAAAAATKAVVDTNANANAKTPANKAGHVSYLMLVLIIALATALPILAAAGGCPYADRGLNAVPRVEKAIEDLSHYFGMGV